MTIFGISYLPLSSKKYEKDSGPLLSFIKKERKQSFRSLKSLSLSHDQAAANRIAGGPIVVAGKKAKVVFIIHHLFNRGRLDDFHLGDPVNEGVATGAHKADGVADIQVGQLAKLSGEVVASHHPVPGLGLAVVSRRRHFQLAKVPLGSYRQRQAEARKRQVAAIGGAIYLGRFL